MKIIVFQVILNPTKNTYYRTINSKIITMQKEISKIKNSISFNNEYI